MSDIADVAPVGPFQATFLPLLSTVGFYAENMIYDPATEKYWAVFGNANTAAVGIASADAPEGPWTVANPSLVPTPDTTGGNAPHILLDDGTFYIYFGMKPDAESTVLAIYLATCDTVDGVYDADYDTPLLAPAGGWEVRVNEPYVMLIDDPALFGAPTYVMFYTGDSSLDGSGEQVGYATASSPAGPFTRHAGNPVVPHGSDFDAGTVSDAFGYVFDHKLYLFYGRLRGAYAVPPDPDDKPGTALAISADMQTFIKQGDVWTGSGEAGALDYGGAFRGALSRFGDTFYMPYIGLDAAGNVRMCMATMDAKALVIPVS